MSAGYYVAVQFVIVFLDVISVAMLIRALLSWFRMGNGPGTLESFLYVVTEPFIMPIRALCNAFGWFQGLPMDMPFLITMILISFSTMLLSGLI